jgi:membrane-anchored protein YejM (alkaline phosphatase superfamily)
VKTGNNELNVMPLMYSTRSISYVIARTGNNELNVMPVMYSIRSISYVIARTSNNDMNMTLFLLFYVLSMSYWNNFIAIAKTTSINIHCINDPVPVPPHTSI